MHWMTAMQELIIVGNTLTDPSQDRRGREWEEGSQRSSELERIRTQIFCAIPSILVSLVILLNGFDVVQSVIRETGAFFEQGPDLDDSLCISWACIGGLDWSAIDHARSWSWQQFVHLISMHWWIDPWSSNKYITCRVQQSLVSHHCVSHTRGRLQCGIQSWSICHLVLSWCTWPIQFVNRLISSCYLTHNGRINSLHSHVQSPELRSLVGASVTRLVCFVEQVVCPCVI